MYFRASASQASLGLLLEVPIDLLAPLDVDTLARRGIVLAEAE